MNYILLEWSSAAWSMSVLNDVPGDRGARVIIASSLRGAERWRNLDDGQLRLKNWYVIPV